jgi:1-acyl-sn-glycerol-3-phosphate acyltransferase
LPLFSLSVQSRVTSNRLPESLQSIPPKPISNIWQPELTQLPRLNVARRLFRRFVRFIARVLLRLLTKTTFLGLEHFPPNGPALIAVNHLGDADAVLLLAGLPVAADVLGKIEMLYDFPTLGKLMDWYGVIWLHRGRPDRRALRCALEAFEQGRFLVIAPEGRYSLTKGLERGGKGAAYLAVKANVPVIPVALTGSENQNVYGKLRRLKRPRLSLSVGEPIHLKVGADGTEALAENTRRIMEALAYMLPEEYRGVYR